MNGHASLSAASLANAAAQSADGEVRPVSAWVVTSEGFNGIVYDQRIALDKLASERDVVIERVTLFRPVTRRAA